MKSLVWLLDNVLSLYMWAVIIHVIMGWLIAFNVINTYNQFVSTVMDVLSRITDPVYTFIRRFIPVVNGIDFSPLVLILLIAFLRSLMREYLL